MVGASQMTRSIWSGSDIASPAFPRMRKCSAWRTPFMGTALTRGGAAMTFAASPVLWLVAALAWAALPA